MTKSGWTSLERSSAITSTRFNYNKWTCSYCQQTRNIRDAVATICLYLVIVWSKHMTSFYGESRETQYLYVFLGMWNCYITIGMCMFVIHIWPLKGTEWACKQGNTGKHGMPGIIGCYGIVFNRSRFLEKPFPIILASNMPYVFKI